MPLRQNFGDLLKNSRLIAKRILKFIVTCLEWVITSLVAVVLGVAAGVSLAAKVFYRLRSKIVGIALLVSVVVLILSVLNQATGSKDYIDNAHRWR